MLTDRKLDLARIPDVGTKFRGRDVLVPRGRSWVPWLKGDRQEVHDENAVHGWERERALSLN